MNAELKLCPFCGHKAEIDLQRGYSLFARDRMGKQVAIYCSTCNADMSICYEDFPDHAPNEMFEMLAENWNKRTP